MPASNTQRESRGGQLPTVIFWTGVGFAPVAAALVLFSTGAGGLRVAAVLAILTVVLVGLSIMLRPDARTVRVELDDVLDEVDALREDVRQDIAAAARATHRAYSEKLQSLYQTVEALRAQVEALRPGAPEPAPPPAGSAMVAGGVVRHTETVQVTTRQMIVDQERSAGYGGGGGTVYGSRPAESAAAAPVASPGPVACAGPAPEESWTEQRLRERLAEVRSGEPRRDEPRRDEYRRDDYRRDEHGREDPPAAEPRRPRPYEREEARHGEPAGDPPWAGARTGDRWASVRAGEHGHELRMGERRAAVRSDDTGTELRIEDRWAEVRRDDVGRRRREEWESPAPAWGRADPPPALPPTGPEPASAWTQSWRDEPAPVNARPRPPDYDLSDDRWR